MNGAVSRAEIRKLIPSISTVNGVSACINSGSHLVDRWLPFGIPSDIPTLNNFLIKNKSVSIYTNLCFVGFKITNRKE